MGWWAASSSAPAQGRRARMKIIAVFLMFAALVAYIPFFLIGPVELAGEVGIIPKSAYWFLTTVIYTGLGFALILLSGLGLIKVGLFKRPCPKVAVCALAIWIAIVNFGWLWTYSMSNYSSELSGGKREAAQSFIAQWSYHDDPIPSLKAIKLRIIDVKIHENGMYCIQSQSFTWMRIPTSTGVSCYTPEAGAWHYHCPCQNSQ